MEPRVERERRISLFLPVEFECDGQRITGLAGNISKTGIYVRTEVMIPAGWVLELRIGLPRGQAVRITARVVHVLTGEAAQKLGRFAGIGLAFTETDTPGLRMLAQTLDEVAGEVITPPLAAARVLIAESDPRLLDRTATTLGEAGYDVVTVSNGVEAYEACLSQRPDLLLCGENMPILDGRELEKQLARDLVDVPVLYLSKPFTEEDLCGQVAAVLKDRLANPRPALRVNLSDMAVGMLLSFLETNRKTGVATFSRGQERIEVRVRDGRVIGVEPSGNVEPYERLLDLLDWTHGELTFCPAEVENAGNAIGCSTTRILLDHARLQDELMDTPTLVKSPLAQGAIQ